MEKSSSSLRRRTFAIGDIHGAHLALEQCLERSGFDRENDELRTIGDICDGWPYVHECVEILLTIKNRIDIVGNHCEWFRVWLQTGVHRDGWWQGGHATARSYLRLTDREHLVVQRYAQQAYEVALLPDDVPPEHQKFFRGQHLYYLDDEKRLFVHAGFDKDLTLAEQKHNRPSEFFWNRDLWNQAMSASPKQRLKFKQKFSEIFIGHTATTNWAHKEKVTSWGFVIPEGTPITDPMHKDIIWNLDTGAGWNGKLTIMDIDTHEYWQSDPVAELYPNEQGR